MNDKKSPAVWIFFAIVLAAVIAPVALVLSNRTVQKVDQAAFEADLQRQLQSLEKAFDAID